MKRRGCAVVWRMPFRRRLGSRGGVLAEVAFVALLLMVLVIGMGSMAVQTSSVENQGRLAGELADHGKWLLEEVGVWDTEGVAALEQLALDRMLLPTADVGAVIHHVGRDGTTGVYMVYDSLVVGGLGFTPRLEVVNVPLPDPGVHALGQVLVLDLGEEAVVVETRTRFDGIPKGIGTSVSRETWAVAPLDPVP